MFFYKLQKRSLSLQSILSISTLVSITTLFYMLYSKAHTRLLRLWIKRNRKLEPSFIVSGKDCINTCVIMMKCRETPICFVEDFDSSISHHPTLIVSTLTKQLLSACLGTIETDQSQVEKPKPIFEDRVVIWLFVY